MQLHSNHASSESPNGYGNQYLYDGEGRICAVATPKGMFQYLYDADGTRVAKGTIQLVNNALSCDTTQNQFRLTASYILDPGGQQLTELDWTSGTAQWAHTNVWAAGQLIATYSTRNLQGIINFYFDDWLGTRRVMTDYTGNVQETCHSLPYGNGEDCGPAPTEHLFTGKERDAESGNDYFGARYYASSMGRWLSPDWSAKIMPVPYAKLDNPQSLNLYAYVGNNPLTRFDPDGHTVPSSCANDPKCSITVKVNVILDTTAKLTKADWKAFQKDFLAKAQKDFGNSNIKLDYSFTNGSLKIDGDGNASVTGMKSGSLNFVATDKALGGLDGGSTTLKNGTAFSFIDIKGLGSGGGPRSTNIFVDSNVFEHELGQQFLGNQSSRTYGQDLLRQFSIDPMNTDQGWGIPWEGGTHPYRTGLEPASFAAPTNLQQ